MKEIQNRRMMKRESFKKAKKKTRISASQSKAVIKSCKFVKQYTRVNRKKNVMGCMSPLIWLCLCWCHKELDEDDVDSTEQRDDYDE